MANTVAVLTAAPAQRSQWRQVVAQALAQAQGTGLADLAALNQAVLRLLDGQEAALPADNDYFAAWQEILAGVAAGGPVGEDGAERPPIMDAIEAFVGAPNWAESQQAVEAYRDLLLGAEVEAIFERWRLRRRLAGDRGWPGRPTGDRIMISRRRE